MTKRELSKNIAEKYDINQNAAAHIVEDVFNMISDSIAAGERVSIGGFGIFDTKERASRTAINPRTKETVYIESAIVPVFKAGKALKEKVNSK